MKKTIQLKANHLIRHTGNSFFNGEEVSYITQYLRNLGIKEENISSFLDFPRMSDEDNPFDLDNMETVVKLGKELFESPDTKVFVQVDADTDGYTSSSILINYLRRRFPQLQVQYRLHTGKEHGVILDTVPADATLVIIPDAGSNQTDEHKALSAAGKTVFILDHHEVDNYVEYPNVYLVNNQTSKNFSNKYMSGAGVVYMFIMAMDRTYFADAPIYTDYRDLAAIGIIADAMNMTSLGNNFLAYYGLHNIKSNFIHEVALKQARGIKDPDALTKIDVAFYIAPVINGVIRSGDAYDKEMVFRAMTEENSTEHFYSEWRGKQRDENIYQLAARLAANAKSRQDSGKKKSFEWLKEKIEAEGLSKDNLIIVTLDEKESLKVNANVTGLIAMELVKYYNKPCLVLRKTEFDGKEVFGGSGRNGNFHGLPSLLDFLHNSGLTYYAEGHGNAFGCFLLPEQVQPLRDYANTHIDAEIFDDTLFEVDYWFHTDETIDEHMLRDFAAHDGLYGNSIPQPKFAFDFNFQPSDVKLMGKDNSSIRLTSDSISFVMFSNKELAEQISAMTNGGHAQIVGRPQLNEWMGRTSVQVMVDDIQLTNICNSSNITSLI